jgi:threonine dehydratase
MNLPGRADIDAAARVVYATMAPTLQHNWPLLGQRFGADVWVKHENHTPIGAFKLRGGLVYLDALKRREPTVVGVVAATRGNHGQSVAYAAQRLGITATVVTPHGNSAGKNAAMCALGAELIEHGDDFQAALEYAVDLAAERRLHPMPSFHFDLVRGVATYALELFQAVPDIDRAYVPIGLGSGICGVAAAREALCLGTELVGVISAGAPAYALSLAAGAPVDAPVTTRLGDGLACRSVNQSALEIIRRHVSRVVTVSDEELAAAIRMYFEASHNVVEGAGAAALAAAWRERDQLRGRRVALICSGGNIDRQPYLAALGHTE